MKETFEQFWDSPYRRTCHSDVNRKIAEMFWDGGMREAYNTMGPFIDTSDDLADAPEISASKLTKQPIPEPDWKEYETSQEEVNQTIKLHV